MGTWGLLVSYGLSALPLSYLYSFAFDGPSSAQISIAGVNFLSGFGFVIAYAVLVRGEGINKERGGCKEEVFEVSKMSGKIK